MPLELPRSVPLRLTSILQSSALLLCNYSPLVAEQNIFLPWCSSLGLGPVNPSPWHLTGSPWTHFRGSPDLNERSGRKIQSLISKDNFILSLAGEVRDLCVCVWVRLCARHLELLLISNVMCWPNGKFRDCFLWVLLKRKQEWDKNADTVG